MPVLERSERELPWMGVSSSQAQLHSNLPIYLLWGWFDRRDILSYWGERRLCTPTFWPHRLYWNCSRWFVRSTWFDFILNSERAGDKWNDRQSYKQQRWVTETVHCTGYSWLLDADPLGLKHSENEEPVQFPIHPVVPQLNQRPQNCS